MLSNSEQTVFAALTTAGSQVAEIEAHTGLKPATIRSLLRALRAKGLVEQIGGRGKVNTYQRTTPKT